ncbi:MAG: NAD(P)/FAD-dependent oxidoreductase [Deltaproteobacteria bacterium]|nr:NAD(P)/FAD-dependent oxidoreductase [Deltaproteobacteria bacterium]
MAYRSISRRSFLQISAMTLAVLPLNWERMAAVAATMGPKKDYPVVIIGAGLGGLCCGAYLAKFGIPVTIVEQHFIPGGYATSFDRASGKFTFEVSLEGTSIHDNSSARLLKELGVLDKLQIVPIPEVLKMKGPGFEIDVPPRDPQGLIALLAKQFPEEKEGIRGVIQEMVGLVEEATRLEEKKGVFSNFPAEYPKMWNARNKTLAELLDMFVKNQDLKNALSSQWDYYGLPPSKLSGFYYAIAFGEYLTKGSYYIKPRAQALSTALADKIEASGGRILYGTEAERILVKDGAATGVVIEGGKTLPGRAVVSNASAITTLKQMLPPGVLPAEYVKKLDGYRPSISTFIVWLGLNKELRGKLKGYDHSVSSGLGPEADYQSALKGDVEKNGIGVVCYDNLFAGYSKPGTSTLKIICASGYEPWRKFEADYREGRKDAYNKEKERWTNILIGRVEKEVIPGLTSMIEEKESATPLTNWRFTRNPEGAIYGFEQAMNNSFMNRIDNRTPVKGLYLASAWSKPGGGYTAVMSSGQTAFAMLMEDWKVR